MDPQTQAEAVKLAAEEWRHQLALCDRVIDHYEVDDSEQIRHDLPRFDYKERDDCQCRGCRQWRKANQLHDKYRKAAGLPI